MIEVDIPLLNKEAGEKAEKYIATLTKPLGSLGRLEDIAIHLAEMTGNLTLGITPPGIIVFAADHGVAKEGVSAFPQEVTIQMVSNIVQGGAAISVFGRQIGATFKAVDVGVDGDVTEEKVIHRKIRKGTGNFLNELAMTKAEAEKAILIGYEEAIQFIEKGVKCLIVGEVGIGNTTSSSAVLAAITGADPATIVGLGSGISIEQHKRKIKVVRDAISLHKPNSADAIDILSKVGGLEMAAMAGAMLAAAEKRVPILLDGFICSVSACLAKLIAPTVADYMILSHESVEPGHQTAIKYLQKKSLVQLNMRLGEGSGAAVAYPILQSAVHMINEMATFESARVAGKEETETPVNQ
ncbi:nicotinate-nucleotide--dimethylbenzimidazole phosphoribosyltransferase [Viridibacillus sp. YIM B01967]|uniref:Nicotinate-nucleotide--dimethylbenzimidazole phosphoribosyltransferase n=1 Tax=Viridibacillus soli TaxID=2798301 RepID=A0ABS1HB98_9BACL|nr:nicotinate-nucleotide--dimethylbenzimidazole phosphoribosyltransferase [Viridibacillus soli]MBK3496263.1 nicotinate-nucleotide--dimethylbenzimidazole phosphoribosyltransferase [Viridibacillus soli]